MKKLLVLFLMVITFACCAPQTGNPDDNIRTNKEKVVEEKKPKVCHLTLFYPDGTSKEKTITYIAIYAYDNSIKVYSEDEVFIHIGRYDVSYNK